MSSIAKRLPFLLLLAAFGVTITHLRHLYLTKFFGFHDVALINDFLASLFHQRRVFHVFDLGVNHLAWHFTPSLFLITPLYAVFSSQFLLMVWSNLAAFAGYAVLLALLDHLMKRSGATLTERVLAGLILSCQMGLTLFPWRVATSGHFEGLFILGAALTLSTLVREQRLVWVVLTTALTLGTREDAGLFLATPLLALLFLTLRLPLGLPPSLIQDRQRLTRRVAWLTGSALLWTLVTVKLIFPAFGIDENWRAEHHWGQLGQSFGEVAVALLRHPGLLFRAVAHGAFTDLNRSLLWLPWLNPAVAFLTNAPGVIFYTMESTDRTHLLYYNSALLLPGLFFAAAVGLVLLRYWVTRWNRSAATVALALLLLPAVFTSRFIDRIVEENSEAGPDQTAQLHFIEQALGGCPSVRSVASDFRTVVFLPNRVAKFLLWNYRRADAVLYASKIARFSPGLPPESARQPDFPDFPQGLAALAHDPAFHLVGEGEGLEFLVRSGIPCSETFTSQR